MNMLSYSNGIEKIPLIGEAIRQNQQCIGKWIVESKALMVVLHDDRATHAEFWQQVEDVVRSLVSFDVKKVSRLDIESNNRYKRMLVRSAIAHIGAIVENRNCATQKSTNKFRFGNIRSMQISKISN